MARIHPTAEVAETAAIGNDTVVWQYAHVREAAEVGAECILGRGVYVGPCVRIGNRCKIQNYALVYEPAVIEDGAFLGPGAIFTNDLTPRAVNPDGTLKDTDDWTSVGVHLGRGASVGARAVCVAPLQIGAWAMVAAGAVVVKDVPDYALVAGVPARRIGWVGEAGQRLKEEGPTERGSAYLCPATGVRYEETDGHLRRVGP
ncbi:N-acetyltransferase [Sinomonas sp. P10A9]|uniref:N-acetyltransferase n=1 Tax=Sinomonas puerhi TaxID=3238584 RepID=A0AB39L8P1_9MICC